MPKIIKTGEECKSFFEIKRIMQNVENVFYNYMTPNYKLFSTNTDNYVLIYINVIDGSISLKKFTEEYCEKYGSRRIHTTNLFCAFMFYDNHKKVNNEQEFINLYKGYTDNYLNDLNIIENLQILSSWYNNYVDTKTDGVDYRDWHKDGSHGRIGNVNDLKYYKDENGELIYSGWGF